MHLTIFPRNIAKSLLYRRYQPSNPQTPIFASLQTCNFVNVPERAVTVRENAQEKLQADVETSQQAEVICKLVSAIGNSRDVEAAMNSATSTDCLSPNVVLQVLKRLNNGGIMAQSSSSYKTPEKGRGVECVSEDERGGGV